MCDIGHSTCEQVNIHHREGKGANPLLVACNDNRAPDLTTSVMQKQNFTTALVTQLPALRRYAIGLVGRSALADDLVQDCFERALGRAAQLREPERLGGWLRRILYNLYIDEVRRRKTRGREEDVAELADQLELSTPAPDNSGVAPCAKCKLYSHPSSGAANAATPRVIGCSGKSLNSMSQCPRQPMSGVNAAPSHDFISSA